MINMKDLKMKTKKMPHNLAGSVGQKSLCSHSDLECTPNYNAFQDKPGQFYSSYEHGSAAERQRGCRSVFRLELKDYKWKFEGLKRVVLAGCKCNCRSCPECGRKRGFETRRVLMNKSNLEKFKDPILLTLTIDPKNYKSPEHAHDVVTEGGYIRRLLRLLGIDTWLWVLEFHKSGWPHWHIVADVSERGRLTKKDLRWCWHLWRDKWGLGAPDVQEKKRFSSAAYAMNYITKYLTMPEKNLFPEWFLKGSRRRLCQASQKVGRLTECKSNTKVSLTGKEKKRKESRALIVRMNECGTRSAVLLEKIDPETFQSSFHYMGTLETSPDNLLSLNAAGVLPPGISVDCQKSERWGYTTKGTVCLYIQGLNIRNCLNSINRLIMSGKSEFRRVI